MRSDLTRAGLLVVNKAQGMTSHDVVQVVRRKLGVSRVGHTGTLDPIAEGVLVLLVGSATRHQQVFQRYRKVYEAVIQLGTQTDTGDAWGKTVRGAPVPPVTPSDVETVLASCVGYVTQIPPPFSAVKVRGRPLYWWTRRGHTVTAKPRTIQIFAAEFLALNADRVRCRITCSSGTYIRTLAETIAQRLGTVGHVRELVRLAVGPWTLDQALSIEWLMAAPAMELWEAAQPVERIDACAERP